MSVQEPFRCVDCGAASAAATRCARCGGRAFELAPPPARADLPRQPLAQLLSLQAARVERSRREAMRRAD